MKKINELEKLRDDTTGDILRMLHDRVSAIEAKLEANTPTGWKLCNPDETKSDTISNPDISEMLPLEANTPQEDTTPSNDHFRKATKMLEPHTSDTSFRLNLLAIMSALEHHEDYEYDDAVDAIVKLAEEHYGKEGRGMIDKPKKHCKSHLVYTPTCVACVAAETFKEQNNGKRD